ncbi:hypothetical protein CEP54_010781 [Fusarium duplospermum]|uniref:Uncharacterized protein n=1 Tax=Fusarium duplospermum TaxID=1325734 RepID=A0A428PHZ7_9HYPO|nr:hypothetical protein CEP54_010781 [Fusarium duplospermum]
MDEQRTARYTTYRPIQMVTGIKHQGTIYPPDYPLPGVEERQTIWTGAGVAPTNEPFELHLPADFDFGKYVWGENGAGWEAIRRIAQSWHRQLSFVWAYEDPIPDGTPFVGEVREAELASVPRVLALGYDGDLAIRDQKIWAVWGMVCCWWHKFCHGNKISLLKYLERWDTDREFSVVGEMPLSDFYPHVASLQPMPSTESMSDTSSDEGLGQVESSPMRSRASSV